jgi:hypothetical protein
MWKDVVMVIFYEVRPKGVWGEGVTYWESGASLSQVGSGE